MCAQPFQVGAQLAMGAQPFQAGAQYVVGARPVAQVGAPFAVCATPATPVGAQPEMFAADWDEKDANALLKLASRARFSEFSGNKIRGFVADLELYLRMFARPVHHWGTFSWLRSARRKQKEYNARTSRTPSPSTRSSIVASKRCKASSNSKVCFARSSAHTRSPALNPSLPTLRAQLTSARRPTPRSRLRHSFRSLWITSSLAWPRPQRAIIFCMTSRATLSHVKKLCRWRRRVKRRDSRCTHPRHSLPQRVRRSTRPHSPNARARPVQSPQRLRSKRRVHVMDV